MEKIDLLTSVPDFTFRVQLEGVPFTFRMVWNMRSGWYISCTAADGETLFPPRRCVADWNVLTGITDDRRPLGSLILFDNSGLHQEAGMDDLNVSHFLLYYTAEELGVV